MYRIIVGVFLTLVLSMPVYAGTPTETLKKTVDEVINVLKDKSLKAEDKREEKISRLSSAVGETFNFKEMAKRALDKHWNTITSQEQKDFQVLFRKLLERTYTERIENYSDEKVIYLDELIKGKYALVKTKVVNNQKKTIPVNYKMKQFGSQWMVYDVVIEGVSLVRNYKTQFDQIITNQSYQELVKRLNKKIHG
jgi:phospholipid transport system substrate-binding protein